MDVDAFFKYARSRHAIYLRRSAGLPAPWTSDPILQQYRFCNVFRELDTTTIWFREHVRDPMYGRLEVLLATVLFRWFNRIHTGEAMFLQGGFFLDNRLSAYEGFQNSINGDTCDISTLRDAILAYCGAGPYVTGSYIVQGRPGMPKLDGVLSYFQEFATSKYDYPGDVATSNMDWRSVAEMLLANSSWDDPAARFGSLEHTWNWLMQHQGLGPFMAYEVVTDLRHTALLDQASDIMTWANPGPGAFRGMSRVMFGEKDRYRGSDRKHVIELMQDVLDASREARHWPQWDNDTVFWYGPEDVESLTNGAMKTLGTHAELDWWPAWEMRDVEHTLCEFDKYQRALSGEGRPRQVFRHG